MSLVQMTLSGGVFILLIAAVWALALHRLPKGTFLVLWEMAALRLLLPFAIPLPLFVPVRHLRLGGASALTPAAGMPADAPALAGTDSVSVLPVVWLTGAVLMAVYFTVSYVWARRQFRYASLDNTPAVRRWMAAQTLRRPLEVRRLALVSSPLTYGVLHPVILLPEDMEREDEAALIYILTHEYMHIRRFDSVAKLVFSAVLCVHWCNPLVWVMFVLANRDMELSCDERVMDTLGAGEKTSYALTLINMEETRKRGFSSYSHFSKLAIEERIEAIMKYKKASVLAVALAVVLVTGTTTAFAVCASPASNEALDRRLNAEAVIDEGTLMSCVDPDDGKTYYSFDNGKTFEAMTDEEFERSFPAPNVEWWTYDEYAAWLEQEKVDLQSMLGEKGSTGSRGEFTWTQEIIDETIAMYEGILQEIKEGKLYSKSVDGDDSLMMSYDPADVEIGAGEAVREEAEDAVSAVPGTNIVK